MAISLITPTEVIKYGPSDHNNDSKFESSQIAIAEYRFLVQSEKCFGEEFYEAMLADIRECNGYDANIDYEAGRVVVYDGGYYQASVAVTQSTTGTVLPINSGGIWVEIGKFNTQAYNTLWSKHLALYLAYCVIHGTVYKKSIRNTSQGYTRNQPQNAEAAEVKELQLIKDDYLQDIETLWNRMYKFLVSNKDDYPLFPDNCKKDCSSRRRAGVYLAPSKNKNCECS